MVIRESTGRHFQVRETGDDRLQHVWYGTEVKKAAGAWTPKKNARTQLVRKAATVVVEA